MIKHYDNHALDNQASDPRGFWIGMLAGLPIGGVAGAVAMLLLAPQSGKRTRAQLERQSHELREQTAETAEDAMAQARVTAHQIRHDVRKDAKKLQQRGHALLDEQKGKLATIVEAGKNAVQGNRD